MAEMEILNATCDCSTDGTCDCDISQLHVSCQRNATEVFAELPSRGVSGTTYLVGNNTDGYTEYIWNGYSFVEMGTAIGTFINPMTRDVLGLGRLGTSATISYGAPVGMNGVYQLLVPLATLSVPGAVKIGSQYPVKHSQPYIVGIGLDSNSQLMFNLATTQSDGSPGCLKHERKTYDDGQTGFEMKVVEASASQMGIVKLLSSINGYEDAELDAMRSTHAASVGLVLDGVESYVQEYITDSRLQEYFDAWVNAYSDENGLVAQIWSDYSNDIYQYLETAIYINDTFAALVNADVVLYLDERCSDEYIKSLIEADVIAKTEEIAEANWTNKIDEAIEKNTKLEVESQLDTAIETWMSDADNVQSVADVVSGSVSDSVVASAEEKAVEYIEKVFSGEEPLNVNGESQNFSEWASSEIQSLVNSQTGGLESKIQAAKAAAIANTDKRFISGLTRVVLMQEADGVKSGVMSYVNDGYKFLALKVAHWTSSEKYGGNYAAVLPPINLDELTATGLGSVFAWHFDAGHPGAGIGGTITITSSEISVAIKYRWTDYVDTRVLGIYAWK